ncbi:hypothetical protein [Hubei narna-like virus 11]|uniref:hypothetical protein n=1 Tax=Hubei narna-like virus 11 TaxID=1922941 RepID=UPI00090B5AE9|nr:hypothetical protein [Hubei narna-like virus 11]APG77213.1 hypothetical protein [Hubei narna-like virus 11]
MTRSRANNSRRKTRRPRKKAPRRKPRSRPRTSGLSKVITDYAKMVMDPCHSTLVRTIGTATAGSVTERLRSTIGTPTSAIVSAVGVRTIVPAPSGYIIWFPSYHNGTGNLNPANCFIYTSPSSSTTTFVVNNDGRPTNTNALPMGTEAYDTTGLFVQDPANNLLSGAASVFSRGTTVSACLQLENLVSLSTMQGQVAVVKNYNLAAFDLNSGTNLELKAPTVNEVFAYAEERRRIDPAGHEVVWRPTDASSVARGIGNEALGKNFAGSPYTDVCFQAGQTGINSTNLAATAPEHQYGICIAWRGMAAFTTNVGLNNEPITLNLIKIVDFELAARNGQIESKPKPPPAPGVSKDVGVSFLDRVFPHWQSTTVKLAHAGAVTAASMIGGSAAGNIVDGIITMAQVGDVTKNKIGGKNRGSQMIADY